ncbi:MAG: N-acetyltransferase family protein [Marivibrio sp.]|uniref:GNAT family N-acetyltransferase n=1 Tax=Marivibrio sp. TaxID=2039719 RepID=UPI0032EF1D3A
MTDPSAPLVRDAVEADLSAITEIYAAEVRTGLASFELEPPPLEEMARRRGDLIAQGFPYLSAELDGRVAGYAYAGPYRPRPAYRFTVENSIYVAAWARRRGVARALLEALIARCEAMGKRQMMAVISGGPASVALHVAAGFEHAGRARAVGWKFERWVDVVTMQRALGPGADQPAPR